MIDDKRDFKKIRTTITKCIKDIDNTKIRLDEIYAFLDKVECRLNENRIEDDEEYDY
jgi:hypothetical protein